ncbi:MAG: carboxypeptidase regulatory-like domain-containing protein [Vicinamibacteria bacterium]|nr:carboxypeptidase regulatory-like domain-containing protein [Vicinamibacteria bacterium]
MTIRKVGIFAGLLAAFVLASGSPLMAQTTTASVSGVVRDAQGGVLAGAEVVLTSNTQGTAQTTTTDARGNFVFPYVRPDSYSLKVTLAGFKAAERLNMVVSANDKLNAGIITLEIGEITESITVSDRVTELQATSGERSYTLESAAITNIAVNGRSFFGLIGLVPGVISGVGQGNNVFTDPPTQVSNFATNGQRTNSNNLTIDGVANIDTGDNGGNMATTNLDAVAEFKVLTSSYQAEYGRAVGAQVQVVTKSGGRDFAGSAYYYARRSDWNANTWTNNRSGIEMAEAKRNDYGYTLGGPIFIPNSFNADRKKLFFFWSQEFQRREDPVGANNVTVPTALERTGDFSQSVDRDGNPANLIRDYTTGLPCEAGDTRGCFADGGVLGKIPQDRLYAPTLASLSLFPDPNISGQNTYNYTSQAPSDLPRREDMIRLDFHPNDSWRFMGRYMQLDDPQWFPYGVSWAAGANVDTLQGYRHQPGYNWMLSAVGVLNSSTAIEFSVGSAHNSLDISSDAAFLKRSASAIQDLPMLYPDAVQEDFVPRFDFVNGAVIANAAGFYTHQAPFTNYNTTIDAIVNMTKVMEAHTVKAGVYFQRSKKDQSPFAPFNGRINFQESANNPYDSGHPYANAALGIFNTFQQSSQYLKPQYRYSNLEWYLQDNWKASRKLTLDYGVRFYYMTPQWDASSSVSTVDVTRYDQSQAVRLYYPAIVGGARVGLDRATGEVVSAGDIGRIVPGSGDRFNGAFMAGQGIDKTLTDGPKMKISPRFGFAYDLTGKQSAVLRGGFAVLYDRPQGNTVFDYAGNPPAVENVQLEQGLFTDLASAARPLDGPLSVVPFQYDWKVPTVYTWNVGMQVKLPSAFVWDISYVGSDSKDLLMRYDYNAVPYGAKYLPENQDPTASASSVPGATSLASNFLRPYTGYATINAWAFGSSANYHALQTALNRRFDKGLLLGVSYTYSKSLGTANDDYSSGRIDGRDKELNYGILFNHRPHVFSANFVYQTPKVASGAAGAIVNGWQLSGVFRYMTGAPYQITYSIPGINNTNITGSDQGGRVVVVADPGKGWSGDPYDQISGMAFAPPQPGSIGAESSLYFVHRPPVNNLDLSLSKSILLDDRRKIEFRVDAFNALNHTQFLGVNSGVNFSGLTNYSVTNLPYDASGNLVNQNGFGTVNGVYPARQIQLVGRIIF